MPHIACQRLGTPEWGQKWTVHLDAGPFTLNSTGIPDLPENYQSNNKNAIVNISLSAVNSRFQISAFSVHSFELIVDFFSLILRKVRV